MLASELIVSSGAACIIAQSKTAWCEAAKRRIDMIYPLVTSIEDTVTALQNLTL